MKGSTRALRTAVIKVMSAIKKAYISGAITAKPDPTTPVAPEIAPEIIEVIRPARNRVPNTFQKLPRVKAQERFMPSMTPMFSRTRAAGATDSRTAMKAMATPVAITRNRSSMRNRIKSPGLTSSPLSDTAVDMMTYPMAMLAALTIAMMAPLIRLRSKVWPMRARTRSLVRSDILRKLDLYELKDCHPMSLSGGQKQRIAIASVLCKNSRLLLFDEPTSGMDYCNMMNISNLINECKSNKKIIFIVSHDQEFLNSIADYVIHL